MTRNILLTFCILFLGAVSLGAGGYNRNTLFPSAEISADTTETLKQFLQKYEQSFNPSQYEIPITIGNGMNDSSHGGIREDEYPTDSLTFTAGFRVQVLTTQDIDQANNLKDTLGTLFPTEWSYIVYHAPNYKVRVGNFQEKAAANRLLRLFQERGFQDAWVVPDEVVKNPPVKLPPAPMPIDTLR